MANRNINHTDDNYPMITTEDNPWNPFTQYDEWLNYDHLQGYNTNECLASLVNYSDILPDKLNDESIEDAMQTLIKRGAFGNEKVVAYKKVYKSDYNSKLETN